MVKNVFSHIDFYVRACILNLENVMSDLPNKLSKKVFDEGKLLTAPEQQIIREQIRKNSLVIGDYVDRLDLIVNQEGHQAGERFVMKIRERLYLLMAENDTFRRVYWEHFRLDSIREEITHPHFFAV